MTSLASQLQAFNASLSAQAPKHVTDTIEAANQRLAESGLAQSALKAGDRAPAFEATHPDGVSDAGSFQAGPRHPGGDA